MSEWKYPVIVTPRPKELPTGTALERLQTLGQRRKDIDDEIKAAVIEAHLSGGSNREIARIGQLSKTTVNKWLNE